MAAAPLGVQAQQVFASVGVNRVTNALAWGLSDTVAYGAHHMVVLYDPNAASVTATMLGHTGSVTCVSWVPKSLTPELPPGSQLLISGAADNTLRIWAVHDGGRAEPTPWQPLAVLQGHTGAVTAVTTHALPMAASSAAPGSGCGLLVVSSAGDGQVLVWEAAAPVAGQLASGWQQLYEQGSWRQVQALSYGNSIQHDIELTRLPGRSDWLLLVTGGTDARVQLHVRGPGPGTSFQKVLALAGHEGWVRSVAALPVTLGQGCGEELLIASASQDRYMRVWRVRDEAAAPSDNSAMETKADESELTALMRYIPQPGFDAAGTRFTAVLESLLIGHEDWVHSVVWQPTGPHAGLSHPSQAAAVDRQAARLLSASMDRSMMLWAHEASSGLWLHVGTLGDAGATCLGYFSGVFSPSGAAIMANGFTGAMHLWERRGSPEPGAQQPSRQPSWQPRHALGGHWDAVRQVAWGVDGGCVLSVSEDQTARLFAETATRGSERAEHWCEIARPQVHGHDFSCAAPLPGGTQAASYAYVCGSEEKVLRVMECTQTFLDTLRLLKGGVQGGDGGLHAANGGGAQGLKARAYGAAVSALGLSNKLVLGEVSMSAASRQGGDDGSDFVPNAMPSVVEEPPLEEHLAQNTLWIESFKLYGHGDALYCCTASPDGTLLASACTAKTEAGGAIWVWDVADGTWRAIAQLPGHSLTVTQLAWSNDSRLLAACSRDRSFTLHERCSDEAAPGADKPPVFRLLHKQRAAHARILWGIAWSPDDALLATGARDNLVKLWGVQSEEPGSPASTPRLLLTLPAFPAAVTAVAWAPSLEGADGTQAAGTYVLAVGLESGAVELWSLARGAGGAAAPALAAHRVWASSQFNSCAVQVNSLSWRGEAVQGAWQLAAGANDHSVRVYSVRPILDAR